MHKRNGSYYESEKKERKKNNSNDNLEEDAGTEVKSAELFMAKQDAEETKDDPQQMKRVSKEQIVNHLKNGTPVIMWVTLDLSKPKENYHWYLQGSGKYYAATTNLHVVVLNGVIGNKVHAINPLIGKITYNQDAFFNSYHQMGKHAVIVK